MNPSLRPVVEADIAVFYAQQLDPVSHAMAAFTSRDADDRVDFERQWRRSLVDEAVVARTILWEGVIAGYVASFVRQERREVCYWLGRNFWGQGIATAALRSLLDERPDRPLLARVAADNVGSLRVLDKCGFVRVGAEVAHARARGERLEEVLLELR